MGRKCIAKLSKIKSNNLIFQKCATSACQEVIHVGCIEKSFSSKETKELTSSEGICNLCISISTDINSSDLLSNISFSSFKDDDKHNPQHLIDKHHIPQPAAVGKYEQIGDEYFSPQPCYDEDHHNIQPPDNEYKQLQHQPPDNNNEYKNQPDNDYHTTAVPLIADECHNPQPPLDDGLHNILQPPLLDDEYHCLQTSSDNIILQTPNDEYYSQQNNISPRSLYDEECHTVSQLLIDEQKRLQFSENDYHSQQSPKQQSLISR